MGDDITPVGMSKSDAWELTDEIRQGFEAIHQNRMEQVERLARAYEGRAWEAMGYDSFDEYQVEEFGEDLQHQRLELEERMGMVKVLADSGMAKTKIAEILGVSRMTIHRDLSAQQAGVTDVTSSEVDAAGQSVEEVGLIEEYDSPSPDDIEPSPPVIEESYVTQESDDEPEEERKQRLDSWLNDINFEAMIIPTQNQIIEANPAPPSTEYFQPRQPAPKPLEVIKPTLPPPPAKRYDEPQPEFLEPAMKLEKVREPNKDDPKHCRTCNCNLLP